MVKKRCRKCQKVSYSLSAKGRWICPGCGEDLGDVPLMRQDKSTAGILPVSGGPIETAELN